MKAIMVMFDSLRRDLLSAYGGEINTPNFERLKKMSCQFDNCYVGSLPCMPARRELHTGRYNFLHRSWGPIEPFDVSMPAILKENGIHTHLTTDHYHYLQDGGATYQGRYSTWDCYRGQEGDEWRAVIRKEKNAYAPNQLNPESAKGKMKEIRAKAGWQNMYNRETLSSEKDFPMHKTFDNGIDFLMRNGKEDNWFLQIETFDPHEPFTSPECDMKSYLDPDDFSSPDWPQYAECNESEKEISDMRKKYFALTQFCDRMLGRVLDEMDKQNLWDDTLLIVNTDHGFLLSEHSCWGKGTSPNYEELSHIPFFVYDPRYKVQNECRKEVVQTIDIAPTILDFFGIEQPKEMVGHSIKNVIAKDEKVRDCAIFGYLGGPIGISDGRYVLYHDIADRSVKVHEYTLMPTHMRGFFSDEDLKGASLTDEFSFTKGIPVLKVPANINPRFLNTLKNGDELYDLVKDPKQEKKIEAEVVRSNLLKEMRSIFEENEAPQELYRYYGI